VCFHLLLRAASCTCPGESHPGPVRTDGSYVGRSAPEIDVFEATVIQGVKGQVSRPTLVYFLAYKFFLAVPVCSVGTLQCEKFSTKSEPPD